MTVTEKRTDIAVLISGTGRHLANFIRLADAGELPIQIAVVVSTKANVRGVQIARDAGLAVHVVHPGVGFDDRMTAALADAPVSLVCMAGFLSLWRFPAQYQGRVINIHPALLPAFGGRGYYGRRVHEAVIASGATESGCTVHHVDHVYDNGPIILQRRVPVLPGDTPNALAARVFEQELIAYPEALRHVLSGPQ